MAIKTTGQFGEYAVASELCRRGLIATTFTRNMPGFDILALKLNKEAIKSFKIQVKTIKSGEWSLDAKTFLEFDENKFEKGIQKIKSKKNLDNTDFFVFVKMVSVRDKDKFYILKTSDIQQIIYDDYKSFLESIKGKRNPRTTHIAIKERYIKKFENNWKILS